MYAKLDGRIHQVRTRRGSAELQIHHVGPLPIIRHFLDRTSRQNRIRFEYDMICLWTRTN